MSTHSDTIANELFAIELASHRATNVKETDRRPLSFVEIVTIGEIIQRMTTLLARDAHLAEMRRPAPVLRLTKARG